MDVIFEVNDKIGRKIYLSKERWKHIQQDHPDVKQEEIKQTIIKPLKIIDKSKNKLFYYHYFKYRKGPEKYLRTVVKYLNSMGFVITAYPVRYMS